jgi:hypothetical protein
MKVNRYSAASIYAFDRRGHIESFTNSGEVPMIAPGSTSPLFEKGFK